MPEVSNPYSVGEAALAENNSNQLLMSDSPYGPAKDSSGVMKIAQGGLIVSLVSSFISIGFSSKAWLADGTDDSVFWNTDGTDSTFMEYWDTFGTAATVVYIVSLILFLVWNNRSVKNAWALSANKHYPEVSPGWAVGYYFMPIVSLWKPFQIMRDTWQRCAPNNETSPLVRVWWTLWIVNIVSSMIALSYLGSETADYGTAMAWTIGDDLICITSEIILILIIRTITGRQLSQIKNSTSGSLRG